LEAVGAGGCVDDDELGAQVDEVLYAGEGGGLVWLEVVDVTDVVVVPSELVESRAGVVAAHLEVDEGGGAALPDDVEHDRVGGECFGALGWP